LYRFYVFGIYENMEVSLRTQILTIITS